MLGGMGGVWMVGQEVESGDEFCENKGKITPRLASRHQRHAQDAAHAPPGRTLAGLWTL